MPDSVMANGVPTTSEQSFTAVLGMRTEHDIASDSEDNEKGPSPEGLRPPKRPPHLRKWSHSSFQRMGFEALEHVQEHVHDLHFKERIRHFSKYEMQKAYTTLDRRQRPPSLALRYSA